MYNRNYFYVSWGGYQITTAEIWQVGAKFTNLVDTPSGLFEQALGEISLQDCYNALQPIFTTAQGDRRYSTAQSLDWVKIAAIGKDGKYLTDARTHAQTTKGIAADVKPPPPQLAMVISLWSGSSVGKGHRGRQYWPCPADTPSQISATDGRIAQLLADAIRNAVKTALKTIEGEVSTVIVPAQLVVLGQTGSGTCEPVTQIACGRVIDTQRRRRNDLSEAKVWAPF